MNRKAQFIRQPRYYNDFHCMGGSCPMSCCLIWRVDWTRAEVERLKNTECSERLRTLIDNSFIQRGNDPEWFVIKMDEKKRCPFLTEDNFCIIQRELGAEYLSNTCMVYPRESFLMGNTVLNYCTLSCYNVMETLCSDKDCMTLENYTLSGRSVKANMDNSVEMINHPELKYRKQIFDFFYEIISDDSHSIETSITLGALAAHSLSKLIERKAYDKIVSSISAMKKQLNDPVQIKKLEELKPNYSIKLGFASEINRIIIKSDMIDKLCEDGGIKIEKYNDGMNKFYADFSDRPFALRNIALNLFMECRMPFRDITLSLFENYCYYVASFAAMKLAAASIYTFHPDPKLGFKGTAAYVSRSFAHNDASAKEIVKIYKAFNCMSPAYIALILK